MNKLEKAYAEHLLYERSRGAVALFLYESVKLRLADRTWYTPDFLVQMADGTLRFVEVKGFWRDDARVKIKVAAELYPLFRFSAVRRRKDGGWAEEVIGGGQNRLAPERWPV